jgi:hypothetical protein
MGQFDTAQICTIFLKGTLLYRLETVQKRFIPIFAHLISYTSYSNMFRLTYIYPSSGSIHRGHVLLQMYNAIED